ncbi:MAG: hypothetical protein HQ538_05225 [Parcubacteria group bacterium]|nr:hypothetical protein [Parcubacteria group bacterium]
MLIIIFSSLAVTFATFLPYLNFASKIAFSFKGEGEPVELEELKEKMKEINSLDTPVMVSEKKKKLIVTWKYVDSKWWTVFSKNGLREVYELHVKFNKKKKRVTLIDVTKSVQWKAGPGEVKLRGGFFRGIAMEYKIGKSWGIKENFELGKIYDYKFVSSEIRNPVLNTILRSGWNVNFGMW